jgi:hypothetical protein
MKKIFKLIGILAIAAIIGFSMAACGGDDGDDIYQQTSGLAAPVLTVTPSGTTYHFSWTSVTGALGYNVYARARASSGGGAWTDWFSESTSQTSNTLDGSALGGYTFEFKIAAYNAYGTEGAMSNVVSVTISGGSSGGRLPAPTGLTATAYSPSAIILTWNAVTGAIGYKVYASLSSSSGFVSANTQNTTNTLGGGDPNTTYYLKVAAINVYGEEGVMSNVVSARTLSAGTYSLNGTWACKEYLGMQITVRNNTTGYFSSLPSYNLIPSYISAVNKGYIRVGDERWRNISNTGVLTFSAEERLVTSNKDDVATGTSWGDVWFTLSDDGHTLTMYNSVNQTGTRIVWTRQ